MKLPKLLKKYNKHKNKSEILKEELMYILINIVTEIKKVDFLVDGFPLTINSDCQHYDVEYNEDEYIYLVKVLNYEKKNYYQVPIEYLNLSTIEFKNKMIDRTRIDDYTKRMISREKEIALEKWLPLFKSGNHTPEYIKAVLDNYHVFLAIYPEDGSIYNHPWITSANDPTWKTTVIYQLKSGKAESKSLLFKMRNFFNELELTDILDKFNKYLDYYFIEEAKELKFEDFIN